MIAQYEGERTDPALNSPRLYGLAQMHKHLKEMTLVPGLSQPPIFEPIVADFYSGMQVNIPIFPNKLTRSMSPEELQQVYATHYAGQPMIMVEEFSGENGFLPANGMTGKDSMRILLTGNAERMVLTALFDNLGKGASGAAVQCMNLHMGLLESTGLDQ